MWPTLRCGPPVICSYPFARGKEHDVRHVAWDLVVLDEARRLRNVYKPGNVIGRTLLAALEHVQSKVLLTATPPAADLPLHASAIGLQPPSGSCKGERTAPRAARGR